MPGEPIKITFTPTPGQRRIVISTERYVVVMGPRGEGKCLVPGSRVLMDDGRLLPIESVKSGRIVGFRSDVWRERRGCHNKAAESFGVHQCLLMRTATGYEVEGNFEHPILTNLGWKSLGDLRIGDAVATLRQTSVEGHEPLQQWMPEFAGLMVGDGSCTSRHSGITAADSSVIELIHTICRALQWNVRQEKITYHLSRNGEQRTDQRLRPTPAGWLRALGLSGKGSYQKSVPEAIFTAPNAQVAKFLGAYFTCDGTVTQNRQQAEFNSVSRRLLRDVKHLLLRFGIISILRPKQGRYLQQPHASWRLKINGPHLQKFAQIAPVYGEKGRRLRESAERLQSRSNPNLDVIPSTWKQLLRHGQKWHRNRGVRWTHKARGYSRETVLRVATHEDNTRLLDLATSDVFWDRVASIEDAGWQEVFNVEVPGGHVFIADGGVVTHNTVTVLMAAVIHATRIGRQYWPIPTALIRDTRVNLGITTAKSMKRWWPPGVGSDWRGKRDVPESCIIYGTGGAPMLDCHFFGCDSDQDLSRFQSFESGIQIYEEPSPAATVSGGIAPQVFALGITSQRANPFPRVFIPSNPPDKGHWLVQLWPALLKDPSEAPLITDEVVLEARKRIQAQSLVVKLKKGENTPLDSIAPGYREANRDMLIAMGRFDLLGRLVEGEVGDVALGEPVVPEFSESLFVVEAVPPIRPGEQLILGWDQPPAPACTIWRLTVGGFADVVASFLPGNVGMNQFVGQTVKPWLLSHAQGARWTHTGDPNMKTPSTTDSNQSALLTIREELGGPWIDGPVSVQDRLEPLHELLSHQWGGRSYVRIDRRWCEPLITALQSRWVYPRDSTGQMKTHGLWMKNASANVGESAAYGAWYIERQRGSQHTMEDWKRKVALLQKQVHTSRSYQNRTGA